MSSLPNPKTMKLHLFCAMLLFEAFFYCPSARATEKLLLCYYSTTASSRTGDGRIMVSDIDPNLCTHIVYYHLKLNIETNILTKSEDILNEDSQQFLALKSKNPQLKVLIYLILKPNHWEDFHVKLMVNNGHVNDIVKGIVAFLKQYKFDGIILSFYPTVSQQKPVFLNLVEALKKAFVPNEYLLSVPGNRLESRLNDRFLRREVERLNQVIDFLILHAYDFHRPSKQADRADHHTSLYSPSWDKKNENVDYLVNYWISIGVPPAKILLGISLYGISWTLSSNETYPPAPAKGPGPPQKFTDEKGMAAYYEICLCVLNEGWQVFQDPNRTMGPYVVYSPKGLSNDRIWVGYDDPPMAIIKSEYIRSKGLGGAAVFDVTFDDFRNKCGNGYNPMLTAIRNTLFSPSSATVSAKKLASDTFINNGNLLFRQKFAFVFSLFFIVCSSTTIIYMCFKFFKSSLRSLKHDYAYIMQ